MRNYTHTATFALTLAFYSKPILKELEPSEVPCEGLSSNFSSKSSNSELRDGYFF